MKTITETDLNQIKTVLEEQYFTKAQAAEFLQMDTNYVKNLIGNGKRKKPAYWPQGFRVRTFIIFGQVVYNKIDLEKLDGLRVDYHKQREQVKKVLTQNPIGKTREQLRAEAADLGIPGTASMRKDQLVQIIKIYQDNAKGVKQSEPTST